MKFLPAVVLAALASASQAQAVLFADDFEAGTSAWTMSLNWIWIGQDDPCHAVVGGYPSGTHAVRIGNAASCGFSNFASEMRLVTPILVPADAGSVDLAFTTYSDTELSDEWDTKRVSVSTDGGASWTALPLVHNSPWYRHVCDLGAYIGASILVRFDFNAVDFHLNDGRGWLIDDVTITARPEPGVPFCFGDWCPCGNTGAAGNGCASSIQPDGANLTSAGTASVAGDSVVLTASGLSNSVVIFFQGNASIFDQIYGAASFGDGRLCVAGSMARLGSVPSVGGAASFPRPTDPPLSAAGALPASGGRRTYQVWYRNAAAFCTSSTFNLTNGLSVRWSP
jgi:hypothetical protein